MEDENRTATKDAYDNVGKDLMSKSSAQEPTTTIGSINMDDLLSDESENDDVLENDAELNSLLREQNLSLDDQNHVGTNGGSGGAALATAIPHYGMRTSGATSQAEDWMANIQRLHEEEMRTRQGAEESLGGSEEVMDLGDGPIHLQADGTSALEDVGTILVPEGWLSNVLAPTPMTDFLDLPSSSLEVTLPVLQPLEREQMDTIIVSDENFEAPSAKVQEQAPIEIPEEITEPEIIIPPEVNAKMTAEIRAQAENALEINRNFQETLKRHLRDVEMARKRNRELQAQLRELTVKQERMRAAEVFLPETTIRLEPPYFVDNENEVPPENADTVRRKMKSVAQPGKIRRWKEQERQSLRAGVIAENKRLLFDMFSEAGDSASLQSLYYATDDAMVVNTKGLDWSRIAQRYVDTRTPSECLIQWTGHDHPGINHNAWTRPEIVRLEELAKTYNERNWIQIALDLDTNRTAAQCFRQYQSKMKQLVSKAPWTAEEENILKEAVRLLGEKSWQQVAYCLENRTAAQCLMHWSKCINPAIRRGRWTDEEDSALKAALQVYGMGRWIKIQQHVLGRTDVQCRERYMNVLTPSVQSGPWTKEESQKLMDLVEHFGGPKWSLISAHMNGRTDNQCMRRYKAMKQQEVRIKKDKKAKPYTSLRRRRGKTTIASALELPEHREQIEEAAEKIKRNKRRHDIRVLTDELNRRSRMAEQERIRQEEYDAFLARQHRIYRAWVDRWGDHVEPIEKVFNLGPPPLPVPRPPPPPEPLPPSIHGQRAIYHSKVPVSSLIAAAVARADAAKKAAAGGDQSWLKASLPDPESSARQGMVRPVAPCVATMETLSKLVEQGQHKDRFHFQHVIQNDVSMIVPPKTALLSAEEQQQPEYRELSERFESVFMWPLMLGMLHMGSSSSSDDQGSNVTFSAVATVTQPKISKTAAGKRRATSTRATSSTDLQEPPPANVNVVPAGVDVVPETINVTALPEVEMGEEDTAESNGREFRKRRRVQAPDPGPPLSSTRARRKSSLKLNGA